MATWIKMQHGLEEKPEVVQIALALNIHPVKAIGCLYKLWCWFDQHTTDGRIKGLDAKYFDGLTGMPGFAQATIDAKWLLMDGECLILPNFDRHNGESAKARALSQVRMSKSRSRYAGSATTAQQQRNESVTREEKSREEKKEQTVHAGAIVSVEDQERKAAYEALYRLIGGKGSASDDYAIERWAQTLPESMTIKGQSIGRWRLIELAASNAIESKANCQKMTGAKNYIASIIERCRRNDCLPGEFPTEQQGPPKEEPANVRLRKLAERVMREGAK